MNDYLLRLEEAGFDEKTLALISFCTQALEKAAGEKSGEIFFSEDGHKKIRDFLRENAGALPSYPYEIYLYCAELFRRYGEAPEKLRPGVPDPPSEAAAEKILTRLFADEEYKAYSAAREALFERDCPENKDPGQIRKKVDFIARRFRFRIADADALSRLLAGKNLDALLEKGAAQAVEKVAACLNPGGFAFAVFYCRCHRPAAYPLYSKSAVKALKYFRDTYHKGFFLDSNLSSYEMYKRVLSVFSETYGIRKFGLSEISLYLDRAGRQLALPAPEITAPPSE